MANVLVVDDDPTVREVVVTYLRASQHEVREADHGEAAVAEMTRMPADLVILDLMLPGIDGLEACRRIRQIADVPIIMLTALGDELDRVTGLEAGADDYVSKPFSPRELVLRVDSVLRRTQSGGGDMPALLIDGDLRIDHPRRAVSRGGERLALTSREYDLLRYLVAHPGVTFSRDELLEHVWGWSIGDRSTVTVHVRRVREKVEVDPTQPRRLTTVWGVGYLWEATA